MSLPVVAVPEDTITLFSQPKPVPIRPYLVGEEKLLLIAQQSNDAAEVTKAVKQIIRRCTMESLNPDKLPSFDIEWLFLQLRSRSVSNMIETQFRCQNRVPKMYDGEVPLDATAGTDVCGTLVPINIDINNIKMTVPEGHSSRVWLNDTIGVTLKYPTADIAEDADIAEVLLKQLETVFTKDGEVTEIAETAPADVTDWVSKLSLAHVSKIRQFFDTMPRLTYTFTFKCPKCGYTEDVTLSGLSDFFD